jgi:hypothetical protein
MNEENKPINTGIAFLDKIMEGGIPMGHLYGIVGTGKSGISHHAELIGVGKLATSHFDELDRLSLETIKMALDSRPSPSDFRPVIIDHSPFIGEPPLNKLSDEVMAKFNKISAERFLNLKVSDFCANKKDKNE